jgi:hypothetical protein
MESVILAALIHHEVPERAINRERLRHLIAGLDLRLIEIIDQPEIHVEQLDMCFRFTIFRRQLLQSVSDAVFQCFSKRDSFLTAIRRFLAELRRSFQWFFTASSDVVLSAYRAALIESVLVDKHVSAWAKAVDLNSDWLLVLEDDALIDEETEGRLRHFFVHELDSVRRNILVYCDLAGGYDPRLLLPKDVSLGPYMGSWTLSHVRTNTICSYLVSRPLLSCWLTMIRRYPLLRQLPADHLINVASILSNRCRAACICLHWPKPFFRHGSFLDGFTSTVTGIR